MQPPIVVKVAEVGRCEMGCRPIVPKGDAGGFPAKANRVLSSSYLCVEEIQNIATLDGGEADNPVRRRWVHKERLFACLWVNADDWVHGDKRVFAAHV